MISDDRRQPTTISDSVTHSAATPNWWQRDDLAYDTGGRLRLAGQDLAHLAQSAGQPVFAYSARRLSENLDRLRQALRSIPHSSRILYAMKANRFLPVLSHLKTAGIDGIDVCSPEEIHLARQVGFREDQISFTGNSVSNADLDCLAAHPGVWVNCDSLSTIRRLAERSPGRKIGLRINPRVGVGYRQNEQLRYAGDTATKFGIYADRMEEALALADQVGLSVTGIHFHTGCGYLDDQLANFRRVLEEALPFLRLVPHLEHINLGGGLGIPLAEGDAPLNLSAWSEVIGETLGSLAVAIWMEPGDYLVKDTGVMVLEINTIEEKGGRTFVGVTGGFNLHLEPAFYHLPLHMLPCCLSDDPGCQALPKATVVGNINEALDVFAEDIALPPVAEGDFLAFLNAGGYGTSMSSNHCMRGKFAEYLVV